MCSIMYSIGYRVFNKVYMGSQILRGYVQMCKNAGAEVRS